MPDEREERSVAELLREGIAEWERIYGPVAQERALQLDEAWARLNDAWAEDRPQ